MPSFDADLLLSSEGAIQKANLASTDGKLNVELVPHDNQIDVALNASKGWVPPLGPQIEFTDLTVKAVATRTQIRVEKFESLLYGGAAKGSAMIVWGGPWSLDGEVETQRIGVQELMEVFTRDAKSTGQLESKLAFRCRRRGCRRCSIRQKSKAASTSRKAIWMAWTWCAHCNRADAG